MDFRNLLSPIVDAECYGPEITYANHPDDTGGVSASGTDGWSANFTKFVSNFNPDTNAGDYAYMWQASPSGGATGGDDLTKRQTLCQRQTVQQTSAGGFSSVSATTFTTYAPTNSCESTAADNFTFYSSSGTMTNDHTSGTTGVTNNLIAPSDTTNGLTASGFRLPISPTGP